MNSQNSRFNRILLVVMIGLYLVSLGLFTYVNWRAEGGNLAVWMHAVNALILSLPLILFYGAAWVLIVAWRERRVAGQVSAQLAGIIRWAPRVAAGIIIFFITLFSLDVFDMDLSPLEAAGAFLIHSLPSIAMLILLAIAWKRPVVGFVAFLFAGLAFLRFVIPGGNLMHLLLFSGPLLLVAGLFYANWRWLPPAAPAR